MMPVKVRNIKTGQLGYVLTQRGGAYVADPVSSDYSESTSGAKAIWSVDQRLEVIQE